MSQHPFQNFMIARGPGDSIYDEGDSGATMYIVQSGSVRMSRTVDGKEQVLGVLEKGDFFGEMSILEGLPRTTRAEAAEDTQLIEINSTVFDNMIRGNIEIAVRMLRKLSIRLREAERKISEFQATGARLASKAGGMTSPSRRCATTVRSGPRLEVQGEDLIFGLGEHETLIGRYDPVTEQTPDLDLTDLDLKRTVSRRHARITCNVDGSYSVQEEVGALNGTCVNNEQLVAGRVQPLAHGDCLTVGSVRLVFQTDINNDDAPEGE